MPDDRCRCRTVAALDGEPAGVYAREHLRLDAVAPDGWSATWSCQATGARWRETYYAAWTADEPRERLDRLDIPPPTAPALRPSRTRWVGLGLGLAATLGAAFLLETALAA